MLAQSGGVSLGFERIDDVAEKSASLVAKRHAAERIVATELASPFFRVNADIVVRRQFERLQPAFRIGLLLEAKALGNRIEEVEHNFLDIDYLGRLPSTDSQ